MRALFTLAAALSLLATTSVPQAAGQASAFGRITGQVRVVMAATKAIPSGVYPSRRVNRTAPAPPEISNVVVYIKDAPKTADVPLMQATIVQKDEMFSPRVVAITRGSTVDFPNADPFFHNVFSLSRGNGFDLGRFPKGDTRVRQFRNAGIVKVYCDIHSHMSATIIVFDHPYFRMPSADGIFALPPIAAGTYHVVAWHERIGESVQTVRVEAGRNSHLEFSLPVEDR
jgi:plastocyanin